MPSSPPEDTNRCVHFTAMKTKVGREGNAPSLAPEGVGQAAKLCPPTSPPVNAGEHSLPKQTHEDGIAPASVQNPTRAPGPNPRKLTAASPHLSARSHFHQGKHIEFQPLISSSSERFSFSSSR